jgi:hypothetical protein
MIIRKTPGREIFSIIFDQYKADFEKIVFYLRK